MGAQARMHRCAHNLRDLTHKCVNKYTRTRARTPAIYHALETDFLMKTSSSESRAEIQTGPFFARAHPPLPHVLSPSAHRLFYSCLVVFLCCLIVEAQPLIYDYRLRQFHKQIG